jgi:hypothetical protein
MFLPRRGSHRLFVPAFCRLAKRLCEVKEKTRPPTDTCTWQAIQLGMFSLRRESADPEYKASYPKAIWMWPSGRPIPPGVIVNHIDAIRTDNYSNWESGIYWTSNRAPIHGRMRYLTSHGHVRETKRKAILETPSS